MDNSATCSPQRSKKGDKDPLEDELGVEGGRRVSLEELLEVSESLRHLFTGKIDRLQVKMEGMEAVLKKAVQLLDTASSRQNEDCDTIDPLETEEQPLKIRAGRLEPAARVTFATEESLSQESFPLHWEAAKGNDSAVFALIKAGYDADARDPQGSTAMHWAAANGHLSVVQRLLYHDINARDNYGYNALYRAAANGHQPVVSLLLANSASVNAKGWFGLTPIHRAAEQGHREIVQELLEHGASVNSKSSNGTTPLHFAVARGHLEVMDILLSNGASIHAEDYEGQTALQKAAENGVINAVDALLEAGAVVEWCDRKGSTAIHLAARKGHVDVVADLIDHSFRKCYEHVSYGGRTDRSYGNIKEIQEFVAKWRKEKDCYSYQGEFVRDLERIIDCRDKSGRTPLHEAAANGHADVVDLLYRSGASFRYWVQDEDGSTALHQAAAIGHENVVTLLLRHGASASLDNKKGRTALHEAAAGGHEVIVAELIDNFEQQNPPVSLDLVDNDGHTALHLAAMNGRDSVVAVLMRNGVNHTVRSKEGRTPLDLAIKYRHPAVVATLELVPAY